MVPQLAGPVYAAAYYESVPRWPDLPSRLVTVGGVTAPCWQAAAALAALSAAGGIMVSQVLRAARSPFACCDFRAAAALYADPGSLAASGRGAAGRPVIKRGFMAALGAALDAAAAAEPARHHAADLAAARAAFAADVSYAAAIARAAVALRRACPAVA